jgi:cyclic pyranopterin phosphate synthase
MQKPWMNDLIFPLVRFLDRPQVHGLAGALYRDDALRRSHRPADRSMVTAEETQKHIEQALGPLEAANGSELDGEARVFHLPGAKGDIGFISSVSAPFCASCTRARLTADGILRMCLLREFEMDLLTPLRSGASLEELRRMVLEAVWQKPWGHGLANGEIPLNRGMSEIGG